MGKRNTRGIPDSRGCIQHSDVAADSKDSTPSPARKIGLIAPPGCAVAIAPFGNGQAGAKKGDAALRKFCEAKLLPQEPRQPPDTLFARGHCSTRPAGEVNTTSIVAWNGPMD
jgi:hypothetical protein